MDDGAQWVTIHEVARIGYYLVTKPPPTVYILIFILFVAALGLQCWVQAFSSSLACSLLVVDRFLIEVVSLAVEHRH